MSFHVGQRVVCVATWHREGRGYGDEIGPVKGVIYTIRSIGYLNPGYPECLSVHLREITNLTRKYSSGICEPSFATIKFRPIVSRKTDISALKALLVPGAKIRETA